MKQSIHLWFQSRLHHLLRDSVRNSWYAQLSFPAIGFRYFHRPHWWRKVAA
jgi:hypothetical protein